MADAPELPEAKNPFEKRVAVSIALMAVLLSYISMKGDNAKTDAVINTNESSNQYAYFQAKSLKEHMAENAADTLKYLATSPEAASRRNELLAEAKRYKMEKEDIKKDAENFRAEAKKGGDMNDRCDFAGLFLQIAIVLASVAILSHQHLLWFTSLGLAVFGAVKFFF